MASFSTTTVLRVLPRASDSFHLHEFNRSNPFEQWVVVVQSGSKTQRNKVSTILRASTSNGRDGGGGGSYLEMWKNASERERKAIEFQNIVDKSSGNNGGDGDGDGDGVVQHDLQKKSEQFNEILNVSREERDRIQRMQVIDRAAAAIAAARAILKETIGLKKEESDSVSNGSDNSKVYDGGLMANHHEGSGMQNGDKGTMYMSQSETQGNGVPVPGPDFWSWIPPPSSDKPPDSGSGLQAELKPIVLPTSSSPVLEKERPVGFLPIPFESSVTASEKIPLPPLQSSIEVKNLEALQSNTSFTEEEEKVGVMFSANAAEAAHALEIVEEFSSPNGVNPDGSRWWKETGIDQRPDGVICRWTMTRGVSADETIEWQEKYWEAADEFGYKELGSEKSGRDATGNVWREYWRESMGQECGLMHIEKTADKWGNNGKGDEWQEQWWERYNATGQTEKWAHKWCSIDPNTPLEAGHAHVWHERWGEKYDGHGGSIKYTDKWAERKEGDDWTKWGDKWDENFDLNANGVKQGEKWWEGKYGERWNRTWGEQHNDSGWVHKYGKSSSGEHWDTHVPEETWYERFPHYGFYHSFDNSVQLRAVPKPSEMIVEP